MSSGRVIQILGGAAVVGGGYYLYQAGGNPKVAEKQIEKDAATLSRKVKGELPGSGKEAKEQGKLWGEQARQSVNSTIEQAKSAGRNAESQASAYAKDAQSQLQANASAAEKKFDELRKEGGAAVNKAANQFDNTVEKKAEQTKGWFGGLFGGK